MALLLVGWCLLFATLAAHCCWRRWCGCCRCRFQLLGLVIGAVFALLRAAVPAGAAAGLETLKSGGKRQMNRAPPNQPGTRDDVDKAPERRRMNGWRQ